MEKQLLYCRWIFIRYYFVLTYTKLPFISVFKTYCIRSWNIPASVFNSKKILQSFRPFHIYTPWAIQLIICGPVPPTQFPKKRSRIIHQNFMINQSNKFPPCRCTKVRHGVSENFEHISSLSRSCSVWICKCMRLSYSRRPVEPVKMLSKQIRSIPPQISRKVQTEYAYDIAMGNCSVIY
jgi:hypothetical protein